MSNRPNIAFAPGSKTPPSSPTIGASPAEPHPHVPHPVPLDENRRNAILKRKRSRSTDLSNEETVKLLHEVMASDVHIAVDGSFSLICSMPLRKR